jgi:hypothetical protein
MHKIRLFGGSFAEFTLQSPTQFGDIIVVNGVLYQRHEGNRVDDNGFYAYFAVEQ